MERLQNSLACVRQQSDECDRAGRAGQRRTQMKIFMIENETDNITVYSLAKDAEAVKNAERFRNEAGLAKLAADWPAQRLVDIWNSLPGVTPVKKFKDRATAVKRIWNAIQNLGETVASLHGGVENTPVPAPTATPVAPQTPDVAPKAKDSKTKATAAKEPPKPAPKGAREGSKTVIVLGLLKRAGGVTSAELMEATGWQAHSVRGFLSGTVGKKMGLTVVSEKGDTGQRTYSVEG
jgi:cell division septation protein DedD